MKTLPALQVALLAALAMAPLQAHHSVAMFDPSKTRALKGTVSKFEWTNPHAWIWVVPDGGPEARKAYGFELAALAMLRRQGWSRNDLKPGDKVTVTYHPYRDGDAGGMTLSVRFEDGRVL